ncbi:hypothetical protein PMIN06_009492 [Paraphaeosphaeria minitans]
MSTATNDQTSSQSAVPARTPTSEHNPLSPLPPEIRHMIYASAYTPTTRSHHPSLAPNPTPLPRWLPSICALNRATYIDAGLWYIATTSFRIPLPSAAQSLAHFSRFLSTFPASAGFDAVRRLEIEYFDFDLRRHDCVHRAALWDFFAQCAKLRAVTLQLRVMNLLAVEVSCYDVVVTGVRPEEVGGMAYLRTVGDVVDACGVDRLFEVGLGALRMVCWEVWPTALAGGVGEVTGRDAVVLTAMPLVGELAGYLKGGFRARGRVVEVVVRNLSAVGLRWMEI